MDIIGKVKIKYEGKPIDCDLYEDGTVVLPDGSKRKLTKEQFGKVSATLTSISKKANANESGYDFTDTKQVPPFQNVEIREDGSGKRKIIKVVLAIVAIAVIAAMIFAGLKLSSNIDTGSKEASGQEELQPSKVEVPDNAAEIEILARVTSRDGSVQEISLSRLKLQASDISGIIDSEGNQIYLDSQNDDLGDGGQK